jgi:hypothetical protein
MTTPAEKGHALEIAVQTIETVILASSPALRGQPFKIERRKTIIVGGVHHEIDIYVKVGVPGYESIFIFECKNWDAKSVNKNEPIVFSEKIKAAVAQRGYFVAKEFTKDALAQSAQDPRMTTLIATEYDSTNVPPPHAFHFTAPASAKCSTTFRLAGTEGTKIIGAILVSGAIIRLRGVDLLLADYMNAWVEKLYAERLLYFSTVDLADGVRPMPAADERRVRRWRMCDRRQGDGSRAPRR